MNNTEIIIDDEKQEVTETPTYKFKIKKQIQPKYRITCKIEEWLQSNLENMKDRRMQYIFSKVNMGFNESTLKSFGKKPVCDVYVDKVEYDSEFNTQEPYKAHSILLCYLKGANNHTYLKACELHDLLMQELLTNHSFKHLDDIVWNTFINDSGVRMRNGGSVMVVFELTHELYR